MSDTKENTTIREAEIDLSDILGTGDSIMTPEHGIENDKKNSIFSPINPDTSFLDKLSSEKEPRSEIQNNASTATDDSNLSDDDSSTKPSLESTVDKDETLDDGDPLAQPSADSIDSDGKLENENGKETSTPTVAALKNLIDKGLMKPFDDDKKLTEYTEADIEELIEANVEQMREELESELPQQFFQNMPPEMQQAYQYIANGGQDLKGMFKALSASQEMRDLDISQEKGQIQAIRSYLQATNYGTPEEIEDEIYSLQDRGELEKKAKQFKPKLDAMQQQIIDQKLQQQQIAQQKRQQEAQQYMENVYKTLEKGELNGIKLDNRTQNMLYAGLVQPNYPSVNGNQTNLLGHLLEKYQFVEPNHGLIAEALYLLADPEGYRNNLIEQGKIQSTEKTVRKLKTEQSNKSTSSVYEDSDDKRSTVRRSSGIKRPKKNFFERL